jgi:3-dehydroquinate synthase
MTKATQLTISASTGEQYPAYVGTDIQEHFSRFWEESVKTPECMVIIDERVEELHTDFLRAQLADSSIDILDWYVVPSGESSKCWSQYQAIVDRALQQGILRTTPVLVIGGGVTGDLGGFAASSIMRGLPLVHWPTTLLAMVDSSIGGKTGINHSRGKNLIGSFYQPKGIWIDSQLLTTLDRRDWYNGISEIIKYSYLADPSIIDTLSQCEVDKLKNNPIPINSLIEKSVRIKANIVAKDAREAGIRAVLNLGHTFGHAMEVMGKYGTLAHGEAVYAGMIAALEASNMLGAQFDMGRILTFKGWYDLHLDDYTNNIDTLIEFMYQDKKSTSDGIRLVLLEDWAAPYVSLVEESLIQKAYERMFEHLS